MVRTRTPGITVLADGRLFIDKRYLGVRIGLRVGAVTQEQAEERLRVEMARIEYDQARREAALPLVRVHDLRRLFARRLRAAGISTEDREARLGHSNHSMVGHCASADVGATLALLEALLRQVDSPTA